MPADGSGGTEDSRRHGYKVGPGTIGRGFENVVTDMLAGKAGENFKAKAASPRVENALLQIFHVISPLVSRTS